MTAPTSLDALIVPAVRSTLGCPLVVLCSGSAAANDLFAAGQTCGADLIAVDFSGTELDDAMPFETTRLLSGTQFERRGDLSAKRNTALLLARYAGWRRIFFLDDDISVDDPDDVRRAASLLDRYVAVGLTIKGFPDGSVATHAHRELGGRPGKFLAGGAFAVAPRQRTSFFPQIYNEDWFYLIDEAGLPRLAITGSATQDPYDPFGDPRRAASEEFGEVVGIGLYYLAESGRRLRDADNEYWSAFLRTRGDFLADVLKRLPSSGTSSPGEKIEAALLSARDTLALINPELCTAYVEAWLRDRIRRESHLRLLPGDLPIRDALAAACLRPAFAPARTDAPSRHTRG
jgi:hypothetical protein